ncbi:coiled-coil domain-containing protein 12 [Culicoides brevitarsis]|uniref:coiled-coil domain-containing protein 12 n=1 Tax=Culicoides brevitarsis TaxID=469753 RepID=UPI00307C888B
MTENSVGNLEQEALKRKERLAQLKRKAEGKPVFRNYKPDEAAADTKIAENVEMDAVEAQVEEQMQAMKQPIVVDEIDISNLAPRKIDWDLKRDVAKKMQILERRTQKAIAELIRERMQGNQEDISQLVNVGTAMNNKNNVDEDD